MYSPYYVFDWEWKEEEGSSTMNRMMTRTRYSRSLGYLSAACVSAHFLPRPSFRRQWTWFRLALDVKVGKFVNAGPVKILKSAVFWSVLPNQHCITHVYVSQFDVVQGQHASKLGTSTVKTECCRGVCSSLSSLYQPVCCYFFHSS